ncbi:sugar transferase [Roseobacter sp. HKCCD5988]|uniref:sugar transferase n=1 Tax=Roseobacter sp. HKCCD5988 TaxID=3120338 RepID=UPI0030EF6ED6
MLLKRLFDFSVAIILLMVFSPLILILVLLVYLFMGRPIFFIQTRAGHFGNPFRIYKFRTMSNEVDCNNILMSDNERITKLGALLRSSSLDELPNLANVLIGNMSLVGPRPLYTHYNQLYSSYQCMRLAVRPGITGLAQIKGRNALTWSQKFRYDVWYVKNWSFCLDLKIIFLTIGAVAKRYGVNSPQNTIVEEFKGGEG